MIRGSVGNVLSIHQNRTLVGSKKSRKHPQKRCLSAARRPKQCDELAALNLYIDVIQHFLSIERLAKVLDADYIFLIFHFMNIFINLARTVYLVLNVKFIFVPRVTNTVSRMWL